MKFRDAPLRAKVFVLVMIGLAVLAAANMPSTPAQNTAAAAVEKTPTVVPRWISEDVIVSTGILGVPADTVDGPTLELASVLGSK